jgi:hypothetical protein
MLRGIENGFRYNTGFNSFIQKKRALNNYFSQLFSELAAPK